MADDEKQMKGIVKLTEFLEYKTKQNKQKPNHQPTKTYMRNASVKMLNGINMEAPVYFLKVISTVITITQVSQLFPEIGIMQHGQSIAGDFI